MRAPRTGDAAPAAEAPHARKRAWRGPISSDATPLSTLTRSVKVSGLQPHHVGRRFVGYGEVEEIIVWRDGYHLHLTSGECFMFGLNARLTYWLTDEEVDGFRRRARTGHAEQRTAEGPA